MISWRSFTTSKVLPTFVGESGYSGTYSTSYSFEFPEPQGTNQAGVSGTGSIRDEITINRYLTSQDNSFGDRASVFRNSTGGIVASQGSERTVSNYTSVTENSTIIRGNFYDGGGNLLERIPTINLSPLATVTQETTKTEPYQSGYRTTKTDDKGFTFKWVTTLVEIENSKGEITEIPSVSRVSTYTTQTIQDNKTRPGTRTITATTGGPVQLKTYTAVDGDVVVVAHTIIELNSDTLAASIETPSSLSPLTNFPFTNQRFTLFFKDEYAETLSFLTNINDYTQTTTQTTTNKTDTPTTRQRVIQETWKQWYQDFEYTESCDPEKSVERTVAVSSPFIHIKTITEETIGNGSVTTFQTFNGFSTQTTLIAVPAFARFSRTTIGNVGSFIQRPRTYTFTNTFSFETTTFFVSGELTKTSTVDSPGFIGDFLFPWKTFGDEAKRLFSVKNSETSLSQSTTISIDPQTIRDDNFNSQTINEGATTFLSYQEKKIGQFYRKATTATIFSNNATAIKAAQLAGLASPALTFDTKNTHSTVGVFMTHNAEHTWEEMSPPGLISQSVVGAVPLTPTFSGLIYRNAEGWELCDTSDYTSVSGSRIGSQFTTTINWQSLSDSSTVQTTSSGTFTVDSTSSAEIGVETQIATRLGGFQTPNASVSVFLSPGIVHSTTYDALGSSTESALLEIGLTFESSVSGQLPITLLSFIPRVQGRGVYTQRLLDNGLP
jgi:hypothetical protein